MATTFTPLASLGGGALIGLSAVLLMAFLGRILGATGILAGALGFGDRADWPMRVALVAGMVLGPVIYLALTGAFPVVEVPASRAMLVIGGLLVGVGVTFGGGCTSGHGVCGLARLSRRSLVATLTFMAATFVTVFVIRHVLGV
ncbi:YeeE/YedE family protein [Acuticoccus sediminis]|uniref:YeeE/YedE family protein n=1 Tax=Acuticoccus sediminis TaxID=2184697 RepID=UPI001CFDA369|nr:YeeE/YedE thiosulfate transporter family protein [Acuticoccus sediminis]